MKYPKKKRGNKSQMYSICLKLNQTQNLILLSKKNDIFLEKRPVLLTRYTYTYIKSKT